jgi:hypothetical protein
MHASRHRRAAAVDYGSDGSRGRQDHRFGVGAHPWRS